VICSARPWNLRAGKNEKELSHAIAEAAVCLSNAEGGLVLIGVDDKKVGPAAITRCPYPALTSGWIEGKIRELTSPPVVCSVVRLKEVVASASLPLADIFLS
jgi:predicted HTH transcriptional regulator